MCADNHVKTHAVHTPHPSHTKIKMPAKLLAFRMRSDQCKCQWFFPQDGSSHYRMDGGGSEGTSVYSTNVDQFLATIITAPLLL